jgi:hypothetical protein
MANTNGTDSVECATKELERINRDIREENERRERERQEEERRTQQGTWETRK